MGAGKGAGLAGQEGPGDPALPRGKVAQGPTSFGPSAPSSPESRDSHL